MESPYGPGAGVMPPLLVGREAIRSRALELLVRTEQFRSPGRSPLILTGVRGVGKTVTLRAMRDEAGRRRFIGVGVTATRHLPLVPVIAAAVAEQVARTRGLRSDRRWHRFAEQLARANIEVSVAGVVKVGRTAPALPLGQTWPPGAHDDLLAGVLADSAALIVGHGRPGLCLTVDEIQDGDEPGLAQLTTAAQQLVDAPLILIGAGLPQTPDKLMGAGSFAERFQYQQLDPLSPAESAAALLIPAQQAGVTWERSAADLVLGHAQGSPYLVQMFADAAWRQADPQPGGGIGLVAARAGLAAARHELHTGLFRGRWNRATGAERGFLTAMAGHLAPDRTASIGDIATALGKPQTQISYLRSRLLDKGLIAAPMRGRLAFTMAGFEDFVAEQSR